MKKGIMPLVVVLSLLPVATDASAQFRVGPQVAWGDDAGIAVGARATANLNTNIIAGTGPLHGSIGFDYFLDCDHCSFFEITPALYVPFTIRSVGPYAGAGLNVGRISYDSGLSPGLDGASTDFGIALIGGLQVPLGGRMALASGRLTLGGSEQLVLSFSWLFGGGGDDRVTN